jgi:hypothetical protein
MCAPPPKLASPQTLGTAKAYEAMMEEAYKLAASSRVEAV